LTKEEIDEISDDPYFYLSTNNGKCLHKDLLNIESWNKEAGLHGENEEEKKFINKNRY